jgi:hypothetical protein
MNDDGILPTTGSAFEPIKIDCDQVQLDFDWEIPTVAGRAMFKAHVERGEQTSIISFELDLLRLAPLELKRLEDFLVRRRASCTSAAEFTATTSWLVDTSLRQSQPSLAVGERLALARQLLLADAFQ